MTPDLFGKPVRALEHDRRLHGERDDAIIRKANPMPATRHGDPETCKAAARDAAKHAPIGRLITLRLLAEHPLGLTDFELATLSGKAQTSIGCRRHDLVKLGYVRPVYWLGVTRITRPAPSGAQSQVWELTSAGRELYAALQGGALPGQALRGEATRGGAQQGKPRVSP